MTSHLAKAYDAWAAVYDGDGNPLVALDDVVVPALVGDVRGHDVLDVGCGTGRHLVKLAGAARSLTGVDASRGMLDVAAGRVPGASLSQLDFTADGLPFADGAFDLVICTLVLEHVAVVHAPIMELARVSRGAVVVSDIHPAMRAMTQANFTDPATGADVRPASFFHEMRDYTRAARAAGLHVAAIVEHDGTPRLVERTGRARKYLGVPMLAAFRFERAARPA